MVRQPDMITTERLAKWGRGHLATLTPERRAQLEADWNRAVELAERHKGNV